VYVSSNESLKKLWTTYIDILGVHQWKYETSGKGVVSREYVLSSVFFASHFQDSHFNPTFLSGHLGYTSIDPPKLTNTLSIYQNKQKVMDCLFDIIPMTRSFSLALAFVDGGH
jgi:hypothetical protein